MAEKIYVKAMEEMVDIDRIIFSWIQCYGDFHSFQFDMWLNSLGISDEDQQKIDNRLCEGKFELEMLAKEFMKNNSEEDCERQWDKLNGWHEK
jgi:hypothetical protein